MRRVHQVKEATCPRCGRTREIKFLRSAEPEKERGWGLKGTSGWVCRKDCTLPEPPVPSAAERALKVLARHNIPAPPGDILELRWIAGRDDWWARLASGWFWFYARTKSWALAPLGPP